MRLELEPRILGADGAPDRERIAFRVFKDRDALDFLESRPDVDPHRIGGLGLSGGGGLVSTAGDYLRFVEVLRRLARLQERESSGAAP